MENGLLKEIQELIQKGYSQTAAQAIGYKEFLITCKEMVRLQMLFPCAAGIETICQTAVDLVSTG